MRGNPVLLALVTGLGCFVYAVWCAERRKREQHDMHKEIAAWDGDGGNFSTVPMVDPTDLPAPVGK